MEDLEQTELESFVVKEGENAKTVDNNDKVSDSESARPTKKDDKEMNSKTASSNLGRFKDAESLFKAYNSLQAEFTKKSQRLGELESELKPISKQNEINSVIDEMVEKYSNIKPFIQQIKDNLMAQEVDNIKETAEKSLINILVDNYKTPEQLLSNQDFLNDYILSNNKIKEQIVREYLLKIKSEPVIQVSTNYGSSIPSTPPKTIHSISEAGHIAKAIIKKQ